MGSGVKHACRWSARLMNSSVVRLVAWPMSAVYAAEKLTTPPVASQGASV